VIYKGMLQWLILLLFNTKKVHSCRFWRVILRWYNTRDAATSCVLVNSLVILPRQAALIRETFLTSHFRFSWVREQMWCAIAQAISHRWRLCLCSFQSVWDLWWTKWHWDRFSKSFGFHLSISFRQSYIFTHISCGAWTTGLLVATVP
jgi:hypothetical protein